MNRFIIVISLLVLSIQFASRLQAATQKSEEADIKWKTWVDSIQFYKDHYGLSDVYTKKVTNTGDGYAPLDGVRNFRVVLHGVYYRGGANNAYNKKQVRPNQNPLPPDGLHELCSENFGTAIYLYTNNFNTASPLTTCQNINRQSNQLQYLQLTAMDEPKQNQILKIIFDHIQNLETKPIYGHCWNGWHASGLISALTLMQFCGWTNADALAYWKKNTDGNDKGYDVIVNRIKTFKPSSAYKISDLARQAICPAQSQLMNE